MNHPSSTPVRVNHPSNTTSAPQVTGVDRPVTAPPSPIFTNKASIGRIVHVLLSADLNNGTDVAPALVTRVWASTTPGKEYVNLRILRDGPPDPHEWRTSVTLWPDEAMARDNLAIDPATSKPYPGWPVHAFWPARV